MLKTVLRSNTILLFPGEMYGFITSYACEYYMNADEHWTFQWRYIMDQQSCIPRRWGERPNTTTMKPRTTSVSISGKLLPPSPPKFDNTCLTKTYICYGLPSGGWEGIRNFVLSVIDLRTIRSLSHPSQNTLLQSSKSIKQFQLSQSTVPAYLLGQIRIAFRNLAKVRP